MFHTPWQCRALCAGYNGSFSFCFANSRLLRGIDLVDIISDAQFIKKQDSLLGLLVAFNFNFNHQWNFRNLLCMK